MPSEPTPPVFVVAEAGVNHDGDVETALRLVDAAQQAGADAVKFQTFHPDQLVSPYAPKAEYQLAAVPTQESQLAMIERLQLDAPAHERIRDRCRQRGIEFMSSPFDADSVRLLADLDVARYKVASGEITNVPLLEVIAAQGRPVILSTGMSHLAEVWEAFDLLRSRGVEDLSLLHCVTEYPAPAEAANLRAMVTLAEVFRVPVGFSDHTLGTEVALAAVALGAVILEKHFTLDRGREGPDHAASLEPDEFASMVAAIRRVSSALGDGRKRPAACEEKYRDLVRRSLAAARPLARGEVLTPEVTRLLRPGAGIQPRDLARVWGFRVRRDLAAGETIGWEDLER